MPKLTTKLLREAAQVAADALEMSGKLNDAFVERYGGTHSDADNEQLADILDYGHLTDIDLEMVDRLMAEAGYPKLKKPKPPRGYDDAS